MWPEVLNGSPGTHTSSPQMLSTAVLSCMGCHTAVTQVPCNQEMRSLLLMQCIHMTCWWLQAFMPRLLHRCGVECYVTGNYSRAETQQLGQHVEQLLKVSS